MTIPQAVIDALAAIPAENPLPDVTTMPISVASLTTLQTQASYWRQVRDICYQQFAVAQANTTALESQADAMGQLLGQ